MKPSWETVLAGQFQPRVRPQKSSRGNLATSVFIHEMKSYRTLNRVACSRENAQDRPA